MEAAFQQNGTVTMPINEEFSSLLIYRRAVPLIHQAEEEPLDCAQSWHSIHKSLFFSHFPWKDRDKEISWH